MAPSGVTAAGPAPQNQGSDLAFAVQVKPRPAPGHGPDAPPAAEAASTPARVAPVKEAPRGDLEQNTQGGGEPHSGSSQPEIATTATHAQSLPVAGPAIAKPTDSAAPPQAPTPLKPIESAAPIEAPAPLAKPPAEPLKQISIQVGQTQQDRVELQVVQRSGELQVAVRSANPDLAQGLRSGLSDLVGKLDQNGLRAEAWRPGGTVTAVSATSNTQQKSTEFQNGGSREHAGSSQEDQQQRGNSNHSQRPKWVEELEGSFTGASDRFPGEFHGISR